MVGIPTFTACHAPGERHEAACRVEPLTWRSMKCGEPCIKIFRKYQVQEIDDLLSHKNLYGQKKGVLFNHLWHDIRFMDFQGFFIQLTGAVFVNGPHQASVPRIWCRSPVPSLVCGLLALNLKALRWWRCILVTWPSKVGINMWICQIPQHLRFL